ncbi:P27 family phage terminase small subunit [Kocuria kalidii]|uniref:P27 family phage terminase small subunit n=1 Tax=Kocuria kalidii TaxID=3376283 RepID=UPI00379DA8B0
MEKYLRPVSGVESEKKRAPRVPRGLGEDGKDLWRAVVKEYDLTESEREILAEACRLRDTLRALREIVAVDGMMQDSPQGRRTHPAVVEARNSSKLLGQHLASLRLPFNDEQGGSVNNRGFLGARKLG